MAKGRFKKQAVGKGILWFKPNLTKKKAEFKYIKLEYQPRGMANEPYLVAYGFSGVRSKINYKRFKNKTSAMKFITSWKKRN